MRATGRRSTDNIPSLVVPQRFGTSLIPVRGRTAPGRVPQLAVDAVTDNRQHGVGYAESGFA